MKNLAESKPYCSVLRCPSVCFVDLSRAVSGLKELTALNLGYNKLDDESSEMLRNYLTSGHASVRKLVLARADIDDGECDAFVKAVACNESLTSVDLSNNLIGAMEIKNAVQPDFNTGTPSTLCCEVVQTVRGGQAFLVQMV